MKRKSLWGFIPGLYILISLLFFTAYLGSENLLPQISPEHWFVRDPAAAEQRRAERAAAKAAKAAAKEAARLAKEEARKQKKIADSKTNEINPVSLEAVARYEAVTEAVIRNAYNRFISDPNPSLADINSKLPAMNAYRLQKNLTDFPSEKFARAAAPYRGQIGLEAAASGAGDIVTAERNRRNQLAAATVSIRTALENKDAAVFDNSRLISDLALARISGFGKESIEPLLKAYDNFDTFTPRQAAGFTDLCRRLNIDSAPLSAAADRLIAQITKEGDIYTVGSDDSVFCGQVLVAAGEWKDNKRWTDVGKTMVASYWEAYPQTAFEEFYDLFDNRYYPKYRTLTIGGKTYRSYTCAENYRFAFSDGRISVTFGEAVGQTFFFLLYDLPALLSYEMYNLNWNRDPNFQNYYAGAFFDANRTLFFVKIMIKVPEETIFLRTQQTVQTGE